MKLSLEQVRHVANLARLSLTPDEEQRYLDQLSAILDAVEQLKLVDTERVEPTSHASLAQSILREDVVVPSIEPEKALANAPACVGTSFAVPRIIE
ncbi:MAG TPA: Asp-tRNA(Asn)/Glu-tRNA(Gln) amidotransferase subunit GatC [Myxococcaceae bacterium]|nr:Asp-tRNA(Asn)/Glu-tRNA(Gln) amidotransferase subunit GatC [Myxococcaceae bacterium]